MSDSRMFDVQLYRLRLLPNVLPVREMIGLETEEVDPNRKKALQKPHQQLF